MADTMTTDGWTTSPWADVEVGDYVRTLVGVALVLEHDVRSWRRGWRVTVTVQHDDGNRTTYRWPADYTVAVRPWRVVDQFGGSKPMPFPGTPEQAQANRDSHQFYGYEEVRCDRCDCRPSHVAASWPCGADVPRLPW